MKFPHTNLNGGVGMRKFFMYFANFLAGVVIIAAFAIGCGSSNSGAGRYIEGLKSENTVSTVGQDKTDGETEKDSESGNDGDSRDSNDSGVIADTSGNTDGSSVDVHSDNNNSGNGTSQNNITGVYACGRLTGIYEQTEGVLVVNVAEVEDESGEKLTPGKGKVKCGDYIISVNGRSVADKEELSDTVNDIMNEYEGELRNESKDYNAAESNNLSENAENVSDKNKIKIKFLREGKEKTAKITPVRASDGKYYMGIWVKDDLAGIGTITYYTKDGRFGALGHGIGDGTESGNLLSAGSGDLYAMELTKIKKGKSGEPGELGGVVYFGKKSHIGTLDCNSDLGIYGKLDDEELEKYSAEDEFYPVASTDEIKTGEAQIISEISGKLEKYNIEIINVDRRAKDTNKGLVIKVTDERLLDMTGGIVQGTSGSPIIQDGRIIGAVTHVFVDDPTRGYGICIEEML